MGFGILILIARETVMRLLSTIDPEDSALRKKHRLHKRTYYVKVIITSVHYDELAHR